MRNLRDIAREAYIASEVKAFADSGQACDPMEYDEVARAAGEYWDRRARRYAAVRDLFAAYSNGEALPIDEFLDAMEDEPR